MVSDRLGDGPGDKTILQWEMRPARAESPTSFSSSLAENLDTSNGRNFEDTINIAFATGVMLAAALTS